MLPGRLARRARRVPVLVVVRGDRGSGGALGMAALLAVAVAGAGVLLGVGVPEKVDCLVRPPLEALAGAGAGAGTGGGAEDCEGTGRAADRPTARGLTATTHSADTVSAPGTPGAPVAPTGAGTSDLLAAAPPGQRCAPALTGVPGPSILCLQGPDGNPAGTEVLVRCTTPTGDPRHQACANTAQDPRPGISTRPADGQTAWCQPLRTAVPRKGDAQVDWACASWAGDVFHCTNAVPRDKIGYTQHGLYYERVGWVNDRTQWPPTCDSRTLPNTDWAGCGPVNVGLGQIACTVPAHSGGAPRRPITCTYFHASTAEESTSHTLGKPLHCTTRPPAPPPPPSAPPPRAPRGPAAGPACPTGLAGPRRAPLVDAESALVTYCRPPVDLAEQAPRVVEIDGRPAANDRPSLLEQNTRPLTAAEVAEDHPQVALLLRRHAHFLLAFHEHFPHVGTTAPTVAIGPPGGDVQFFPPDPDSPGGGLLFVPSDASPGSDLSYEALADGIVDSLAIGGADPTPVAQGMEQGLANVIADAAAGTSVTVAESAVQRPTDASTTTTWVQWVASQFQGLANGPTVAAVLAQAAVDSGGQPQAFMDALAPAIAQHVPFTAQQQALTTALAEVQANPLGQPLPPVVSAPAVVVNPDGTCMLPTVCQQP